MIKTYEIRLQQATKRLESAANDLHKATAGGRSLMHIRATYTTWERRARAQEEAQAVLTAVELVTIGGAA